MPRPAENKPTTNKGAFSRASSSTEPEGQRDVLFGKLAISRSLLTRQQASECLSLAREYGQAGLASIALDRGYIQVGQVEDLVRTMENGEFVCRSGCRGTIPLKDFPAYKDFFCEACGAGLSISMRTRFDPTSNQTAPGLVPRSNQRTDPLSPAAPDLQEPGGSSMEPEHEKGLRKPASASCFLLSPGTRLAQFRIIELLGRGKTEAVYKAENLEKRRIVALKVLHEGIRQEATIDRFARKAQTSRRLDHPTILQSFAAGHDQSLDRHWLEQEFVDGRSLTTWRQEPGRTMLQGLLLLRAVLDGLAHAHERSIVHRDLKPSNILVAFRGDSPKLCGFGSAPTASDNARRAMARTAISVEPMSYAAPEQFFDEGQTVGPAADVWSIGVMLYEMAAGRLPFHSKTPLGFLRVAATETAPSPRALGYSRPPKFEEIILRCLEKQAEDRFEDATQLRDALASLF